MSGPSTRSHRSSVRGTETTLTELSGLLKANKSVVIITGAGLSVASGIPTFRGGSDSVWCVTAAAQGRRSVFLRDPLRWYNEFFLKYFPMSFTRKTPNAGHEAIASLVRAFPKLRVITQNIDGLHQKTANGWADRERLIEVHGRLGLFKCVAEGSSSSSDGKDEDEEGGEGEDSTECPFSFEKEIRPSAFPEVVRATLEDDEPHAAAASGLRPSLSEVPRCPHCGEPSPPMSLLFDEDYDSHSFYDFDRAEEWFKGADAVVFVGTSFAVTLTSLVIREAKRRRIPVYDFNVTVSLKASPALDAKTVLGPAEETLPTLARLAGAPMGPTATAAPTASITTAVGDHTARDDGYSSNSTSAVTSSNGSSISDSPSTTPTSGGDRSPLGRRAREDSPDSIQAPAAKVAKCSRGGNREVDAAGVTVVRPAVGSAVAAAADVPASVWGGGAKYLLQPQLETPLRKEQVRVDLSEAYSRKRHPDPEVEATVEVLWQEQLAKNPLLFNGTKFRLAGFSTEGERSSPTSVPLPLPAAAAAAAVDAVDGTDFVEEGEEGEEGANAAATRATPPPRSRSPSSPPTKKLRLLLGLTDYRTFRGTNWSPSAARLTADGARDFPWLEGAYLSQKLGVGAVVETSDGFLLSLRRSSGVGEGQGMMGAPGGHPEPQKIGLTGETLSALSGKQPASRRKLGQQATDELFDSAVQEVVDETNIPRSELGEALLSGVVRQGNSFGAPTAAFIIPCFLDRAAVSALYARGAKEAFESTEMKTIPGTEIAAEGGAAWFAKRGLQATPSFEGALELWRAHRMGGLA